MSSPEMTVTVIFGDLSRDEKFLLLYLETCAVDLNGRVNARHMNKGDFVITEKWKESKFIDFGRIKVADHNSQGAHWVELSESAWMTAHQERRARHARNPRRYKKTSERDGE